MHLFAATAFAVFVSTAGSAMACSCLRAETAESHLYSSNAALVFKGRSAGTRSFRDGTAATTFRVQEVLRGRAGRMVVIRHRIDEAACGLSFVPNQTALVIADRGGPAGFDERPGQRRAPPYPLRTSLCSRPQFSEAEYRRALARRASSR